MPDESSGSSEPSQSPGRTADGDRSDTPPDRRVPARDVPRQVLTWVVMVLIVASLLIMILSILSDDAASAPSSLGGRGLPVHIHIA